MPGQDIQLAISSSPHLRSQETVPSAMKDVLIALLPVTLVSIYMYRFYAVFLIAVCMISAVLFELLFRKVMKKQATLYDCSALVTGLLLALCLRPGTSWWTAVLAAFFAVGIAKELMGGLGWNRFNPALFGLVAVTLLAPLYVGANPSFAPLRQYFGPLDVITQATPLALIKQGAFEQLSLSQMLIASPGGALGETSALALIIGGAYLLYKKQIRWHIPVSMIGTILVIATFWGNPLANIAAGIPLYHIFAGGVLLGAFFMATDWVTSPVTTKGQVIFGIAIGVLVMLFRKALGPTEGVAFSILIMNAFVPMIDRLTRRPKFGELPVKKEAVVPTKPSVSKST
ncbi:MAG TPA: RnfABCDGE type electron transport complex subunit D [Bacillota bacterium]|jgi:electron transport complex protein RnfD|nr:RnfABCDGE type electron transport complex subunit D [Bacillota bacterium]NMD32697.1 RnfABCDGE type electron transport complex subunit D [Bacillota bacterium]HOB28319.1 RnfABCDGE type electron transport complex subunit D [Bacillota bacterium]HPZ41967.1 RnfABCDGE type electron transport complex subunit D [Bacillota bacterium]HQD51869.1 RnfABCDGE type electron transport complex subunit D [Bacillota bacterium]